MEKILRQTCLELLSKRGESSTICPSEIPRHLAKHPPASEPDGTFSDWRSLMDGAREEVWKLAEEEVVEVTQGGQVRTVHEREKIKGPIRMRRGKKWVQS